ncbi:hypothetical protein [Pseudomonas sp. zfem002]|uniref:hypothetical protein n=1 Tax=Pseudomonas sp. zfem002 TaxID=3078197 RepID=UPI002929DA7C|nr:hypothetical protein [Pseudomonas sp. zfem002]MDU9394713.1 hypothetical protein [Pseudomonas sp. zfem002]
MESALIGLFGVVLGLLANELLRRKNRIENYAQKTFEKRLDIFEELYSRLCACGSVGSQIISSPSLDPEVMHQLVSDAVHDMAEWCDLHALYLNEEVTLQCVSLLMGVEDIHEVADPDEKQKMIDDFHVQLRYTKNMLKKESGIEDVNKSFTKMIKARYSSPVIDYYRSMKKARRK